MKLQLSKFDNPLCIKGYQQYLFFVYVKEQGGKSCTVLFWLRSYKQINTNIYTQDMHETRMYKVHIGWMRERIQNDLTPFPRASALNKLYNVANVMFLSRGKDET